VTSILGVDFSGATLAGEKIWVAHATTDNDVLHFDFLERAANLPGGAPERERALAALRAYISQYADPKCGFDFPFSLSRDAITDPDYKTWLGNFAVRFSSAEALKVSTEDKRRDCDIRAKTPFSPLNLRLYRQTYYGIRDVLAPLQVAGARILPFDMPGEGHTQLLEVCPASLLKQERLYLSYKGKSATQRQNRATIANELARRTPFSWSDELKARSLDDSEGDALDAILSAVCVHNALKKPEELSARTEVERFEGKVYF
jgi:hypothetical protein